MIIGLTGPNGAGKGEVASHLKDKGFSYFSLSDVVREEAVRGGLDSSRENLIKIGNELRLRNGPAILARKIREKINGNTVVDSIRNPQEAVELKKEKNFFLVGIDAPIKLRFQRCLKRGRIGNGTTIEEFQKREEMENSNDSSRQQLGECMKMADYIIWNNSTKEELYKKVDEILYTLEKRKDSI